MEEAGAGELYMVQNRERQPHNQLCLNLKPPPIFLFPAEAESTRFEAACWWRV